MTVKTMTMAEIREYLANDDVKNITQYVNLFDIFLNGNTGYNSLENDDCIDCYIRRFFPEKGINDKKPVELLHVLDDGDGEVFAKVIQHKDEVTVEFKFFKDWSILLM